MERTIRGLLLALGTLSLCACSTVTSKSDGALGDPYSGTRRAYGNLSHGGPWPGLILIVVAADVPLSAVADTLILPVDLLCCHSSDDPAGEDAPGALPP